MIFGVINSVVLGCALLAFSAPCALSFQIVFKKPVLTVIAVFSAGYWLLSCLITSLFWIIFPVLQSRMSISVVMGTFLQEVSRWCLLTSYRWLSRLVDKEKAASSSSLPLDDLACSIASGVGFGFMHILVVYGSLLGSSISRATLFVDTCPSLPLIFVSGVFAIIFFLLDLIFMVVVFQANKRVKSQHRIWTFVVMSHLAATLSSMLNQFQGGCTYSLAALVTVFLVVASVAKVQYI